MFFFTLVTHRRRRFLCHRQAREFLHKAIDDVRRAGPFDVVAFVLLPDHLHCIWELPPDDSDFSTRWARIKKNFTQLWIPAGGRQSPISSSRTQRRERGVWQRRFWEHTVRDAYDLARRVNYIHYNPVRHGLVKCPHECAFSSFHRWVKEGHLRQDWLCACNLQPPDQPDFEGLQHSAGE
jgi:putative transposase